MNISRTFEASFVTLTMRGFSASTMRSAPFDARYTYRPSVLTMSASSTPTTWLFVPDALAAFAGSPGLPALGGDGGGALDGTGLGAVEPPAYAPPKSSDMEARGAAAEGAMPPPLPPRAIGC